MDSTRLEKLDEIERESFGKYISKDTYLVEQALHLVKEFTPRPGNQPLQSIIDGLEEFLSMNSKYPFLTTRKQFDQK